ncbi:unnamed protein product [Rotaria sordida]|uniref:U-box domain-containing protein n=1 Tax=Rotaria sordida TaxID=392033 RepID=A0A814UAY0_9BILA|nr:unnamed protein product [Rotaria sordida]CAF1199043.1 unnamed protein product [Rotaria sordida]
MASTISSVPDEYLCPITRDIMMNPVILIEDGCSYEESAIQSWLQIHNTSPMTNNVLSNRNYTPNRALKSLINDFITREQLSSRVLTQEFLAFNICKGTCAEEFAIVHQMPIVHISAFRGDNVANIFKQLIIRIMENDILINDLIAQATSPDDLISQRREIVLNQNSTSINPNIRYTPHKHKVENKFTCCN